MKKRFYYLSNETCHVCYLHDSELLDDNQVYAFMRSSVLFGIGSTEVDASEDLDFNLSEASNINLQS